MTVVGRLTSDAEVRFTPSGKAVANFTVAVNHRKKQGDNWIDDGADFFRIAAWESLADPAAEYQKGDWVEVTGRFRTSTYTAKNGETRASLDLTADKITSPEDTPRTTPKKPNTVEESPW